MAELTFPQRLRVWAAAGGRYELDATAMRSIAIAIDATEEQLSSARQTLDQAERLQARARIYAMAAVGYAMLGSLLLIAATVVAMVF